MSGPLEAGEAPTWEIEAQWAGLSSVEGASSSWAHGGLVVTEEGELIGFHAGQLVSFDGDGHVRRVIRPGLVEGHGITLVREADEEFLWIADPGFVFTSTPGEGDEDWQALFGRGIQRVDGNPRVIKVTLEGEIRMELPIPSVDHSTAPGMMGEYCPCDCAVDEERFGGNGDIWIADGYGSSLVYRFDSRGNRLTTLSGEEGGGRFICPHAVFIDRRAAKRSPELYIADRENRRIQVFDLDGRYLRTCGESFLSSPSGFAVLGDLLVVAELYGRLALLDINDSLVGYIGNDPDVGPEQSWPGRAGWPNELTNDGRARAPHLANPETFNSPHSVAVDSDGNLYVSEWLLGGRYSKLSVQPRGPIDGAGMGGSG